MELIIFCGASLILATIIVIFKLTFTKSLKANNQRSSHHAHIELDRNENKTAAIITAMPAELLEQTVGTTTVLPVKDKVVPISVNYHFTRKCNYKCGFCFHTAKTSFVLPLDTAKKGLQMLKDAGMEKINFSGGEPFIVKRGTMVGEMVRFCKQTLQLPSVSVVSNGSLISENWFKKYGEYLDILAVSCDSFDPDTNEKIGRQQGQKNHLDSLLRVRRLCMEYKVAFKLNTVVNTYNKHEDMTDCILQLDPCRWKVFQCLLIDGENAGQDALRNAETFVINDEEFDKFLDMHKSVKCLVPESNEKMQNSYLILDEYMRFLDCTQGSKQPSRSLLDVGVDNALMFSGFDERMFLKRGGKYVWSKSDMNLEW
ncbi:radical S-adenosyl methionine domain-containing protein 2-like isoform X4 [Mercenaria mercenaria]|uniref:radical S-adenosyl methionine domain-containing protein 2-like isoform X4 n=1 Tax=Mercenaria mercenaria TaxID=6596 RepID=UPI00234F1C29|nr:radical S-adenosyl methionine domain-containing protein 2-like isoform X4 [Mercenaria mercenaria]